MKVRRMAPALEGVIPTLREVLRRYPQVAAAYVFGSLARGEAGPESDLDVGLLLRRKGETALDHHRMLGDLAGRLESHVAGRNVDLVVLEAQGPIFCHRVLMEGALVYEADRGRRIDFESSTYVRAMDFRPTYETATRGKLAAVRQWLAGETG